MRLEEFDSEKQWWNNRVESNQAWKVSVSEVIENNYNLDIKNPNKQSESHDDPLELLELYKIKAAEVEQIQKELKSILSKALGTGNES